MGSQCGPDLTCVTTFDVEDIDLGQLTLTVMQITVALTAHSPSVFVALLVFEISGVGKHATPPPLRVDAISLSTVRVNLNTGSD